MSRLMFPSILENAFAVKPFALLAPNVALALGVGPQMDRIQTSCRGLIVNFFEEGHRPESLSHCGAPKHLC